MFKFFFIFSLSDSGLSRKSGHSGGEPKKTQLLLSGESPPPPYDGHGHHQQSTNFGLPSKSLASASQNSVPTSLSYHHPPGGGAHHTTLVFYAAFSNYLQIIIIYLMWNLIISFV